MGDVCDMSDLERFMRCPEGQAHLETIRQSLAGRTIKAVEFYNSIQEIGLELTLDNGSTFECQHLDLDVDTLRDQFQDVLEREQNKDGSKKRPQSGASL